MLRLVSTEYVWAHRLSHLKNSKKRGKPPHFPLTRKQSSTAHIVNDSVSSGVVFQSPPNQDISKSREAFQYPLFDAEKTQSYMKLVETIKHIPDKVKEMNARATQDVASAPTAVAANKHGGLFLRQLLIEKDQHSEAVAIYKSLTEQLMSMGKATGLKLVQRIMLKAFEPLTQQILEEIRLVKENEPGVDRRQYGPCLLLLPPEKLAVITLDCTLNAVMRAEGNQALTASVVSVSKQIGDLIEAEVLLMKLQKTKDEMKPWQRDMLKQVASDKTGKASKNIARKLGNLIEQEDWSNELKLKLGSLLILLLVKTAKTESGKPAYIHSVKYSNITNKRLGTLQLSAELGEQMKASDAQVMIPRYLPMLVPPREWDNKAKWLSCYYQLKTKLVRSFSRSTHDAVLKANMTPVLEALNYVGQIPWRINTRVLDVVKEAWNRGLVIGEIPSQSNIPMPTEEECWRVPERPRPPRVATGSRSGLGAGAAGAGPIEVPVATAPTATGDLSDAQSKWMSDKDGGDPDYWITPRFDERYFKEMCRRVHLKNAELHSLRCDMQIKFWVADKFKEDKFYFPYSMDFRGRAYPVPQNLNHLGSDFCRGILWFGDAKPLGPHGMFWMKVHLANLFGHNKIQLVERVEWVNEHMKEVIESAKDPLDGGRWWAGAEDPFQALATCFEIVSAEESGDPQRYMCRLPIHQDGSCNGLQHYAALGKDFAGGEAVNLTPSSAPQDVYSKVLEIVLRKLEQDKNIPEDETAPERATKRRLAHLVGGIVNRKVIKQTVMTSVYGVTRIGASLQVQARLEERMLTDPNAVTTPETEKEIFQAARYVAGLTLESLGEMFVSAKDIMDWLGTCAALVATQGQSMSWITPLGLPVIQPYRKPAIHVIRTILQSITLAVTDDALPVYAQKQRSAFPPNFVHSLDATHMLMTSLKMKNENVTFAAVHDSYWTHPCDVELMGQSLRECFVELYSQPILESLHESLTVRYPDIDFPAVPERGTLDISQVRKSSYFFH